MWKHCETCKMQHDQMGHGMQSVVVPLPHGITWVPQWTDPQNFTHEWLALSQKCHRIWGWCMPTRLITWAHLPKSARKLVQQCY